MATTHSGHSHPTDGGSAHTSLRERLRREMATIPPHIEYLNTSQVKRNVIRKEQYLTGQTREAGDEELFDDEDEDWNPFDRKKPRGAFHIMGSPELQGKVRKLTEEFDDILVLC